MRVDAVNRLRGASAIAIVSGVLCLAMMELARGPLLLAYQSTTAPATSTQITDWLRSAEQLLLDQRGPEAIVTFERARAAAQQLGLDAPQAQALCGIAEARYWTAQYAPAREAATTALQIYERLSASVSAADRPSVDHGIGRASHTLSLIADQDGKPAEAAQFAERAVAAQEAAGNRRARAVSTLQLLRVARLEPAAKLPLYERAVADARASSDRIVEARALHALGDFLFSRGEYVESLARLDVAAAIFGEAGRRIELGTVYNSLGRLYRAHGRVDVALDYQMKALAIHEKTNSPFNLLQSLNAVATTYQALEDYGKARVYFERALELAERGGSPRIRDLLRAGLASSLLAEGEYQQAASTLEGVIARKVDAYPGIRLSELAEAYLALERHQDALTAVNNALKECGARDDLACIRALNQRAAIHASLGDRDAAIGDLRNAMQLVEAKRSRLVPEDFFKQQFNLAQRELYSRAIALQTQTGHNTEALETAELARSRAFVDLLATRDLSVPSSGVATDERVTSRTTPLDGAPLVFRGTRDPGAVTAAPPDRLSSHASVPAASADDLIATARRLRSTLLAYWVGRDEVFVWVVSPEGGVRASQVTVRTARLQDLVRATTTPGSDPATGRVWRDLYDLLIKPVRADLPRTPGALLTIVPNGPIASVSFSALQNERGRYLIEDYTLHYAPGGAVLQFTAARKRATARSGRVLLVSDPVPPVLSGLDPPLPRLPGARAESQAISNLLPRQRVTALEDTAVSESAVREAVTGKAVLHFATHAVVRDNDPFSSFLAVGRKGADDGLLTAREIYGLRLDADLVVLSACRSGSGRVIGDGIATFARAFIYAGAPSVVASLWDVADEPTNHLLPQFYRAWLAGATKASALRTAQLRLLSELRAGKVRIETPAGLVTLPDHPVFWAGFALIGEPD